MKTKVLGSPNVRWGGFKGEASPLSPSTSHQLSKDSTCWLTSKTADLGPRTYNQCDSRDLFRFHKLTINKTIMSIHVLFWVLKGLLNKYNNNNSINKTINIYLLTHPTTPLEPTEPPNTHIQVTYSSTHTHTHSLLSHTNALQSTLNHSLLTVTKTQLLCHHGMQSISYLCYNLDVTPWQFPNPGLSSYVYEIQPGGYIQLFYYTAFCWQSFIPYIMASLFQILWIIPPGQLSHIYMISRNPSRS